MDTIITNEEYWDCECEIRFIHPKSHEMCSDCFAVKEEQPDSIESEIQEINMAGSGKCASVSEEM